MDRNKSINLLLLTGIMWVMQLSCKKKEEPILPLRIAIGTGTNANSKLLEATVNVPDSSGFRPDYYSFFLKVDDPNQTKIVHRVRTYTLPLSSAGYETYLIDDISSDTTLFLSTADDYRSNGFYHTAVKYKGYGNIEMAFIVNSSDNTQSFDTCVLKLKVEN